MHSIARQKQENKQIKDRQTDIRPMLYAMDINISKNKTNKQIKDKETDTRTMLYAMNIASMIRTDNTAM